MGTPSVSVRALAGALALALAGCGEPVPQRSVLLVTIDTTRADRIGCYGHVDAGTPTLDALAARGTRFARAYATAPITLPSHASVLTGSYPPQHGVRDNGLFVLGPSMDTLAEAFAEGGRRTAAFVSAFPLFAMFGLDQGFELYDDRFTPSENPALGYMKERPAEDTVASAIAWLEGLTPQEAFFAWVHLFDPHDPLQAPPEFAERFPDDPYQAEIAYADHAIGTLLDFLETSGRAPNTVVAVTSDHGESLGDHREEKHAILLYDSTIHVPLILAGPGVPTGIVEQPVSLVDVAATLFELAGLGRGARFEVHGGRSLVATLHEGAADEPRELYFETLFPRLHHGWSELVGLDHDGWKYVEAPGARTEDGEGGRGELYRPVQDPGELEDLAEREPERARDLAERLARLRERLESEAPEPERRELEAGDLESLAALGYGGLDVLEDVSEERTARDPRHVVEAVDLLNRVRSYALANRLQEAARALETLARVDPESVIYYESLAELNLARGRAGLAEGFERAADALARACELRPGRRGLWTRRAEALQSLGRFEEALEYLEHALTLAPPTPILLQAREALVRAIETPPR